MLCQFAIQKYQIIRINENHPMIEKRAYLLPKRWWQRRQEINNLGCNKRMTNPINREILGTPQIQQEGFETKDRSGLGKKRQLDYFQGRLKWRKPSLCSVIFICYVCPIWKSLGHPSHKNMVTKSQRCTLLYIDAWQWYHI